MIENKTKCFLFQNKRTFSALFRIKLKKKKMIVTIFFISVCYWSLLLTKLFNLHYYVIRLDFCGLPSLVLGVRAHFLEQHLVLSSLTILCMMLFF